MAVFKTVFSHGMEHQDGCFENISSACSMTTVGGIKLGMGK